MVGVEDALLLLLTAVLGSDPEHEQFRRPVDDSHRDCPWCHLREQLTAGLLGRELRRCRRRFHRRMSEVVALDNFSRFRSDAERVFLSPSPSSHTKAVSHYSMLFVSRPEMAFCGKHNKQKSYIEAFYQVCYEYPSGMTCTHGGLFGYVAGILQQYPTRCCL